ncbi:MAG: CBS domain-containing protein [Planctomycetota bacterium]
MNVKVADVMAKQVITAQPHHTIGHVRDIMTRNGIHAIPIVGPEGEPAGIITTFDLARAQSETTPVNHVMTEHVYTIPQYNDVHHAARLMRNHRVHHVVVTHEQEIVGILSSFDLLQLVEDHRYVEKPAPTPAKKSPKRS